LYEAPTTAFVAGFIGENNRIHGRIAGRSGQEYRVETKSGKTILIRSATIYGDDEEVLISIRPERVRVATSEGLENSFPATVEEVIYFGDHSRIHLKMDDTTPIVVKIPNTGAALNVAATQQLNVSWGIRDGALLPAI
jgi:putative spermidine/putrescine transport system ATP-binding protein